MIFFETTTEKQRCRNLTRFSVFPPSTFSVQYITMLLAPQLYIKFTLCQESIFRFIYRAHLLLSHLYIYFRKL